MDRRDEEVTVRGKLADPDRKVLVEKALLQPEFVQLGCGSGLGIAYADNAVDVIGGDAAAMDLKGIGVEA